MDCYKLAAHLDTSVGRNSDHDEFEAKLHHPTWRLVWPLCLSSTTCHPLSLSSPVDRWPSYPQLTWMGGLTARHKPQLGCLCFGRLSLTLFLQQDKNSLEKMGKRHLENHGDICDLMMQNKLIWFFIYQTRLPCIFFFFMKGYFHSILLCCLTDKGLCGLTVGPL